MKLRVRKIEDARDYFDGFWAYARGYNSYIVENYTGSYWEDLESFDNEVDALSYCDFIENEAKKKKQPVEIWSGARYRLMDYGFHFSIEKTRRVWFFGRYKTIKRDWKVQLFKNSYDKLLKRIDCKKDNLLKESKNLDKYGVRDEIIAERGEIK